MAVPLVDSINVTAAVPLDAKYVQQSRTSALAAIPVSQRYRGLTFFSLADGFEYHFKSGVSDSDAVRKVLSGDVDGNAVTVQVRRGLESTLMSVNPTPKAGEVVVGYDGSDSVVAVRIGTGVSVYSSLPNIAPTSTWSDNSQPPTSRLVGNTIDSIQVDGGTWQ